MSFITRIAPSPTGDMHLGTARTAYFSWLAARSSGGEFILRIDDTDKNRSNNEYVKIIIETMNWLGLDYDRIYYQSKRLDRYHDVINLLIKNNFAQKLDDGAVSFNINNFLIIRDYWVDNIAGRIKITDNDIKNINGLILLKQDGTPTYNFASVVDDIDFGVNYIIRGHDHISNTSKQALLFDALSHPIPQFAHVGLIHLKKKKLSKRDGSASMLYYKDKGYDPDAILNFMLRLGWGPTIDDKSTKLIDRDRALELFLSGGKMKNSPANMDINMLEAFDRKYKAKKGIWRTKVKLLKEE